MVRIGGIVVLVLLALTIVSGALLTSPSIATPAARLLLGGDKTSIGRAWVSYGPWPVAHVRTLEIEGRGHADAIDAHINPLGILPGVGLIPQLAVDGGALLLELGPSRGSRVPGILDEVSGAALAEVRLDIQRPERDPQVLTITTAQGELKSGAFTLKAQGGGATIHVEGKAAGLSLASFNGTIRAEGDNFATLADLLGLAAPDTPPYVLTGELRRSGETWRFGPFEGDVGDSDLAGELSVDFAGERPFVRADLTSTSLDFDDLGVVVGAPSDLEEGAPNERQQEIEANYQNDSRFLPDTELDFKRLQAVDAEIRFVAESVRAGPLPLEGLEAEITLDDATLSFEKLIFTAPQGRLEATGRIEAQDPASAHGELTGSLSGFELAQVGGGRVIRGTLLAEFDVSFAGSRTREAFASLDGELAAWSTDAELRALVEEGAGLDLGEVVTLLLTESEEQPEFSPARCLAARAAVDDGVATVDPAVIDTADSVTRLKGVVDLETEQIDLRVESDAKDVSWGSLFGGVQIGGTLRQPRMNPPLGGAAVQGGAAALLGGLTAGLAALPFIELGLGEDAPCAALLAQADAFASQTDESAPSEASEADEPQEGPESE